MSFEGTAAVIQLILLILSIIFLMDCSTSFCVPPFSFQNFIIKLSVNYLADFSANSISSNNLRIGL